MMKKKKKRRSGGVAKILSAVLGGDAQVETCKKSVHAGEGPSRRPKKKPLFPLPEQHEKKGKKKKPSAWSKKRSAKGLSWVAVLEPGDLLYIPPLWLHEVTALLPSISVNVWTGTRAEENMRRAMALPLPAPLSGELPDDDHAATCTTADSSTTVAPHVVNQRSAVGAQVIHCVLRKLRGGGPEAGQFLKELFHARYANLAARQELHVVAYEESSQTLLHNEFEVSTPSSVSTYVDEVVGMLQGINEGDPLVSSDTSSWVANWVEFVAWRSVPLSGVSSFLSQLTSEVQNQ